VTEIPEHLLKRSRERKAGATGGSEASATPAKVAAAAAPAAAAKAPVAKAATPVAKPDPAYVRAAKERRKIPFWAMLPLSLLPVWAWMYVRSVQDHPHVVQGPRAAGAVIYGKCASCHGAEGGGGTGRQLNNGEVLKTFPAIEDQLRWVAYGTEQYKSAGVSIYGNPNRPGGVHNTGSYGVMPGWQGELTDAQILAVVCYVRYDISGADATGAYAAEYAKWCAPNSPQYTALEGGKTFADTDFANIGAKPKAGRSTPFPG
jgi:mono/diheme cytochrome c family protein